MIKVSQPHKLYLVVLPNFKLIDMHLPAVVPRCYYNYKSIQMSCASCILKLHQYFTLISYIPALLILSRVKK